MASLSMMFVEGGPFVLVVLLFTLLGLPLAVIVGWVVGFARLRLPASAGWVMLTAGFACGLVGAWFGGSMAVDAASQASAEMKQALMAQGIAVGMYNMVSCSLFASVGFLAYACTAWLPLVVSPGPEPKVHLPGLVGAAIGWVVGLGVAALCVAVGVGMGGLREVGPALYFLPVLSVAPCAAIVLGSLRVSEELPEQGRVAGSRVGMGFAGFLGLGLSGELFRWLGVILVFQAVASAAPESKTEMLEYGLEVASWASRLGWSLALIPVCVGVGAAAPILGRISGREAIAAVVGGLQVVVVVAGSMLGGWLVYGAFFGMFAN